MPKATIKIILEDNDQIITTIKGNGVDQVNMLSNVGINYESQGAIIMMAAAIISEEKGYTNLHNKICNFILNEYIEADVAKEIR